MVTVYCQLGDLLTIWKISIFLFMALKIKKILVPLDGSSNSFRGLDVAIHLARQCHATITGLYVVGIAKPRTDEPITSPESFFLEYAQKIMKKAKLKAAQKGILFFDRVSYGDDEKRIVDSRFWPLAAVAAGGAGDIRFPPVRQYRAGIAPASQWLATSPHL